MLPMLVLLAATATIAPSSDGCVAFQKRAAAVGPVTHPDGAEGEEETSATEAWHDGHLSYAFTSESAMTPPVCASQRITYDKPGFVFGRADDTSIAAITDTIGADAASDFEGSKLVAATKDATQTTDFRNLWYRGKKLGFSSSTGSQTLTVMPLDLFDAAVTQSVRSSKAIQ
jgi:hypothetical protein